MTHRYSLYGLTLESELALVAPAASASAPTDLHVRIGEPHQIPHEPATGDVLCQIEYGNWGAAHVRTQSGYTMRYYGTAEFDLTADLERVTAHTDPRLQASLLPELLIASVPAFVLLVSGRVVLHASAVAKSGRAIAILAQTGGGKSTIAAALCEQGFVPVTDDVLAIDWANDVPRVRPGPTELRLRAASIVINSGLSWAQRRQTVDGRTAVSVCAQTPQSIPLKAIVTPVLGHQDEQLLLTRMESNEALTTVLGHLRVAGWKDTPVLQRLFAEQVRLAREVPAYRLTLPWGPKGLREAATTLRDLAL